MHQVHLARGRDDATADILIVVAQGSHDIVESQPVGKQRERLHNDVVLSLASTPSVHLGHARDSQELGPEHPVVQGR